MPLRVRITNKAINPDNTITVDYTIAWAANGNEIWQQTDSVVFPADSTKAQVMTRLRQIAEAKAGAIQAMVALDDEISKTYERQPDGTWKVV